MAATMISETDLIDVSSLSFLIYGPPGAGKTFLAQTADDPFTLDLDRGIHRASNRKSAMRFDSWMDIAAADAEIAKHKTIVVDTVGRCLDMLTSDIVRLNAKHGSIAGGLTLQGYGVLKARFAMWVNQLRLAGKDLIFIAHEKEEKDGDDRIMRPDIQGGSYTEVMKFTDLVGYISVDRQGQRAIDFNPSDRHLGKNAAGWDAMLIPQSTPDLMAALIADAKKRIGHTAVASASLAKDVQTWADWLAKKPDLDTLNNGITDLAELTPKAKKQAWNLIEQYAYAEERKWTFDRKAKRFNAPSEAA